MTKISHGFELLLGENAPRADAERNVRSLLTATKELVAEGDLNPSSAQIAARAHVGVGTLYRRALSKESLLAAAVIDMLGDICAAADAETTADSWSAFEDFAIEYLRIREITCSITHELDDEFDGGVAAAKRRTREAFENLTRRLRAAGYLDDSVEPEELMVLLASIDIKDDTLGLDPSSERRERVVKRLLGSLRSSV